MREDKWLIIQNPIYYVPSAHKPNVGMPIVHGTYFDEKDKCLFHKVIRVKLSTLSAAS
jgi:hypothetical protein